MSKKKEKCFACEHGMELSEINDAAAFKAYGWFAHAVQDDPDFPHSINYHTHGVDKSWGHKDIQVCLPLSMETIHTIVTDMVGKIKDGEKFKAGEKIFGIIGNDYPVTFKDAVECGRPVLRIIFPDLAGCLVMDEMEEFYAKQWD